MPLVHRLYMHALSEDVTGWTPESITFNGHPISIWKYQQLESLSRNNLELRALNLREQIGQQLRLPPLQKSVPHELLAAWWFAAQLELARSLPGMACRRLLLDSSNHSIIAMPGAIYRSPATWLLIT